MDFSPGEDYIGKEGLFSPLFLPDLVPPTHPFSLLHRHDRRGPHCALRTYRRCFHWGRLRHRFTKEGLECQAELDSFFGWFTFAAFGLGLIVTLFLLGLRLGGRFYQIPPSAQQCLPCPPDAQTPPQSDTRMSGRTPPSISRRSRRLHFSPPSAVAQPRRSGDSGLPVLRSGRVSPVMLFALR